MKCVYCGRYTNRTRQCNKCQKIQARMTEENKLRKKKLKKEGIK